MNRRFSRIFVLAFLSAYYMCAHSGTISIPNPIVAGTPANAAAVQGNFQALADAINVLSARVDKLDGTTPLTASDMVGQYDISQFRTNINNNLTDTSLPTWDNYKQMIEFVAASGVMTLNADGTGTLSLTNLSTLYGCHYSPPQSMTSSTNCPQASSLGPKSYDIINYPFTWNFASTASGYQLSSTIMSKPMIIMPGAKFAFGVDQVLGGVFANNAVASLAPPNYNGSYISGTMITIVRKR